MSYLAQHPDRLHPPEDFLDSFPLSLAYLITQVSSGALVQPALRRPWFWATCGVTPIYRSSSMNSRWSYPLSAPNVTRPTAWQLFRHQQPGMRLGRTVGRGHPRVHHQSVPILRHQVSVVAQLRFLSLSLAGQHGFRIGGGTVRLIARRSSPCKRGPSPSGDTCL